MAHDPNNESCPWNISMPVDPDDMYNVGDCTCQPAEGSPLDGTCRDQPTRYVADCVDEDDHGEWVGVDDYKALEAKNEQLRKALSYIADGNAEFKSTYEDLAKYALGQNK